MNYKKIIRNKEHRIKILSYLKFIPDTLILKLQYKMKLGRKLNLKEPIRFTEKLQWYKINYRDDLMTQCADKYSVRSYIESKGLKNILTELYGVYDKFEDIEMNKLPNKFVLKTNNGSGTNLFCENKKMIALQDYADEIDGWMERDNFASGREWSYRNIEPKIVIEEYLEDKTNKFNGINDYKFICFNGDVKFIVFDVDRQTKHKRNIYDGNWNFINVSTDKPVFGDTILKPNGLEEMKSVARKLSKEFPFVRVDLYWINNKVYFGELTFYPWTGYVQFNPDNFDFKLGEYFKLSQNL